MKQEKIKFAIAQFSLTVLAIAVALFVYHEYVVSHMVIEDKSSPVGYFEMADTDVRTRRYNNIITHGAPDNFVRAANKSTSSVVYVIAYEKMAGSVFSEGYTREKGSGVIISEDGYIVTNNHVVANADFIEITLEDKREFVAEVIGTDETTDLALLKIESTNLPHLVFANSDSLQVGEWILAIGNPFGLQSTVTAGIVSAKARSIDALSKNDIESFIQSDAVINPGSSGGALVDTDGLLMGICTAILSSSGNYEGLSFAIPSNLARKVIIDLKQFGSVQRGKLGITISDVNADLAKKNNLPAIEGVIINSINLNSAAAEAGFTNNDIIVKINDVVISSTSEFYETINQYRPGDLLSITYYHRGMMKFAKVILRNHLNTTDYISVRSDSELKEIGIEIRDLNSIEKERMQSNGIMVISISKESIISDTNMEPGFIVEYFNEHKLVDTQEFIQHLKSAQGDVTLVGFYERYPGKFPYTFTIK